MTVAAAGPYRFAEAAAVLGVSDDTLRRWAEQGRFTATTTGSGNQAIDGPELARLALALAESPEAGHPRVSSARNRMRGIVTAVKRDGVMAQVELCCGPFRVVSLMSREAADDLDLRAGRIAVASVKATTVVVDLP